jgi:hypothetical protein
MIFHPHMALFSVKSSRIAGERDTAQLSSLNIQLLLTYVLVSKLHQLWMITKWDSGSKSARNSCRRTQLSKCMSSAESANAEAFDRLTLRVRCIHMNCGSLQTFNNYSSSALSFDFV